MIGMVEWQCFIGRKAKPYSRPVIINIPDLITIIITRLHRGDEVMARLEVQKTSCTTGICQGSKQIILPGSDVLLMRWDQIRNLLQGSWLGIWLEMWLENLGDYHWWSQRNIKTHKHKHTILFTCSLKSSQSLTCTMYWLSFCIFCYHNGMYYNHLQVWKETYSILKFWIDKGCRCWIKRFSQHFSAHSLAQPILDRVLLPWTNVDGCAMDVSWPSASMKVR